VAVPSFQISLSAAKFRGRFFDQKFLGCPPQLFDHRLPFQGRRFGLLGLAIGQPDGEPAAGVFRRPAGSVGLQPLREVVGDPRVERPVTTAEQVDEPARAGWGKVVLPAGSLDTGQGAGQGYRPPTQHRESGSDGGCAGRFRAGPSSTSGRRYVAHRANFGAAGAGLRERPHDAAGWQGHRRSPPAPAVTHNGQNRCLGRRRQMGPAGDDAAQVGVLGSQCRRVTPTSTPTCCIISGFTRGIRRWPLDCKSAIVGSTPTGASFFSSVPPA